MGPEERMSNSRKILSLILFTMLAVCLVACSKEDTAHPEEPVMEESQDNIEVETDAEEELVSFEVVAFSPAMIKVETLPEWLSESDLEDGFISTHKLMEIAKNMGKDLELEADGKIYTIKANMVLHGNIEVIAEEPENEENTEEEIETAETPVGTSVESPSQSAQTTPSQPAQQTPPQQTSSQPSQPAHEHNWVAITTTVHHDAVTEEVWVVDVAAQAAWDEEVTEWETYIVGFVTGDGKLWATKEEAQAHALNLPVDQANYSTKRDQRAIVTVIHHDGVPEQGHYETVVKQAAYDETVTTGYKCSSCGAQK